MNKLRLTVEYNEEQDPSESVEPFSFDLTIPYHHKFNIK